MEMISNSTFDPARVGVRHYFQVFELSKNILAGPCTYYIPRMSDAKCTYGHASERMNAAKDLFSVQTRWVLVFALNPTTFNSGVL